MYTYRKNIILLLFSFSAVVLFIIYLNPNFLQKTEKIKTKLPNDIRWVVQSDEYKMLCEKIYAQATIETENLYSSKTQAIIMDLDETVLDNSKYQVENFDKGENEAFRYVK